MIGSNFLKQQLQELIDLKNDLNTCNLSSNAEQIIGKNFNLKRKFSFSIFITAHIATK